MGLLLPNLRPDLDALRAEVAVATLRDVVKDGWSILRLSTGMADAFVDQTGIASLGGGSYDAAGRLVTNRDAATSYANPGGSGDRTGVVSVSASGMTTYAGSLAALVDGSTGNGWALQAAAGIGAYIQFDFGSRVIVDAFRGYKASTADSGVWSVSASNDGSQFDALGSISWGASTVTEMAFANSASYRYYRMTLTSGSMSAQPYYNEMEFRIATGNIVAAVVTSAPFTLGLSPTDARVVMLVEKTGGSIGTDCLIELSRNGSDWALVPLSKLGTYDAWTHIVGGMVSLLGQGAGSKIYWRWSSTAAYAFKLRGIWIQCK